MQRSTTWACSMRNRAGLKPNIPQRSAVTSNSVFGIGLVVGLPFHEAPANLCERSMSKEFGLVPVNLVWRKGALPEPKGRDFIEIVKSKLTSKPPARGRNGSRRKSKR